MSKGVVILTAVLAAVSFVYAANPPRKTENNNADVSATVARSSTDAEAMREQGKQISLQLQPLPAAPHKFPPRMMATIVRHMRVRAMIRDEDMRLFSST